MNSMRPLKIVINAFSARLGGGQSYLRNILPRIPSGIPIEIHVFCPDSLPLPADPRIRRSSTVWPTTNPILRMLWERFALPRYLLAQNADILFCPGGIVTTKISANVRIVTTFQNMIPFVPELVASMPWGLMRLRNVVLRRLMLKSMATADLTIFISNHARNVVEALIKIPKPVTIPHGISELFNTQLVSPARPDNAPHSPYILYVSRFDLYKHHDKVVEAFADLPEELRKNYTLVFLGETNLPPFETVVLRISELGLNNSVLIGGSVPYEKLPGWYAHADIILFASSCENCPIILLESLGAGRPIVCSNVMPMPELGGPGLVYFSPFDSKSITAALREVLESPERASALATFARQQSKLYNWDIAAKETWETIVTLADKPKKR
jgi:glycosyltransferase involved in cell wall biosynthesis